MKKCILVALAIILCTSVLPAQSFDAFVLKVIIASSSQKNALVDSFMTANPHLPYIDNDTTVYFVYRGTATSVTIPGDANGWDPHSFNMSKLSSTNLWYYKKNFPSDARLDYQFYTNGSNWILDPNNPNTIYGGYGPNSELRMPAYVGAQEIAYDSTIAHGTYRDTTVSSAYVSSRTVRVYMPAGYASSSDSFPVILIHDGLDYWNLGKANNVLDYLIGHDRMQPVIAVLVPAGDRQPEYAGTKIDLFSSFVFTELMPYIDARYRTRKDPHYRAVLGASDGGNISLYLAGNRPDVFGLVAAQSSDVIDSISHRFQNNPKFDLKVSMDLGTYDIAELIPLVHNFVPILQAKGYDYIYHEFHEGHSWGNWRAHMHYALEFFFPGPALGVGGREKSSPAGFELLQNYPNPFNPKTYFRFHLPETTPVTLKVYDLLGREAATVVNQKFVPGSYSIPWDASALPSGIYFYQLQAGRYSATKKLLLLK